MRTDQKLSLLGGLTPEQFMRRHWHKKPLLIRQAMPGIAPLVPRAGLFELASRDDVESRLIVHEGHQAWTLKRGPLPRRVLPPLSQPGWTVLVQGVDLHVEPVHRLMQQFRFVPDARLDDLMISYATDGGGVGPHVDSYDVFLLQVHGRRRWRVGRLDDPQWVPGVPLKILRNFEPEEEWVLEPGDMLYLPPGWAHDGVAEGECMTYSIGFRSPRRHELAREVLVRMLEAQEDDEALYRDPKQAATTTPGLLPPDLRAYAGAAVAALLRDEASLDCALGEYLTEPKQEVWFAAGDGGDVSGGVRLDRRTRMMYDAKHIYINGESYRAAGRDATLMRRLADARELDAAQVQRLGEGARALLEQWADDGWLGPPAIEKE
ncbi:cupin domain-containing protein [Schlegelella sp. S2-27]|uniref:Cupin domain-containing protein n=1 Tax=Caldimonas mangrovi TaxID=2944811 RepID=A0ABT0YIT0_9BURK|nr:cupin domain-containing protein [Caldimonas mangrovi]MCM5678304.1 cupin domain-containing protein [Caldimonas mangrovi]